MPRTFTTTSALIAAAALAFVGGCARTIVKNPLDTNYPPGDVGAEMGFWDGLKARSAVTNDEALHGLFLLVDNADALGGYDARRAEAVTRGWLPADFAEPADMAMQRGRLATALCKIAKIRGGVIMSVIGPGPRYATRELVYLGIMQDTSTEYMSLTGSEYVATISNMQDYLAAHPVGNPPAAATPTPAPETPAQPGQTPATQEPAAKPGFSAPTGPVGTPR